MALVGKMGGEDRKTEQSGYKADFSAVYEYNQLMKQLADSKKNQQNTDQMNQASIEAAQYDLAAAQE